MLVDDHALFSKSLEIALSDAPEVEAFTCLRDIARLDDWIANQKPDILLMDINLKNISSEDGLELARQVLARRPEQKVVIPSGYDLPGYRSEARKIGARGFVHKNIEPEALLSILRHISQGAFYFAQEAPPFEALTGRERQVLRLMAQGHKRKEIAAQLYISERTLSNHLQHIFEKLDATSAVEAITKAVQLGYLPPLC